MANKDSAQAVAKAALQKKAMDFQTCFGTASGEKVLKALVAQFSPAELFNPNSDSATFVAIGEHNVITYIQQMMRVNSDE